MGPLPSLPQCEVAQIEESISVMKMANWVKFEPAQLAIEEAETQIWVHFNFDFCFLSFLLRSLSNF